MKNSLLNAALVAAVLALPLSANAQDTNAGASQQDRMMMNKADHAEKMHQMMQEGMKDMHSMQITGDMDRDFAVMMRHHHQQGVKMAQMQLAHGKDAKMKAMAKKIVDTQKKEIQEFDQWLGAKGAASPGASSSTPSTSGSHSGPGPHTH